MKTIKILSALLFAITLISCDTDDDSGPPPDIDIEATEINFSIANRENFVADATITGTVTNIRDDFRSGENQQSVLLYERSLGTPSGNPGNLVAQQNFANLDAGATITVSYTRRWNASSPAEGEFPPDYILVLTYDPDLFIDGNDENDDTNTDNNRVERNGQGINMLFN